MDTKFEIHPKKKKKKKINSPCFLQRHTLKVTDATVEREGGDTNLILDPMTQFMNSFSSVKLSDSFSRRPKMSCFCVNKVDEKLFVAHLK